MSNYFRALSRLKVAQRGSESLKGEPVAEGHPESAEPRVGSSTFPGVRVAHSSGAHSRLLENIRTLTASTRTARVLVAGVSTTTDVTSLVAGLTAEARESGIRILVAHLSISGRSRALIARQQGPSDGEPAQRNGQKSEPLAFDLEAQPDHEAAAEWVRQLGVGHDIVVIEGPPLLASVESALLAEQCEGLVLVVELFSTSREDLAAALERAERAGANVLGLVTSGASEPPPPWLRRFSARSRGV